MVSALLAHQGGWDEILMVVGPLALLWFLLRKAKARADAMAGPGSPAGADDSGHTGPVIGADDAAEVPGVSPDAPPTPPAG